MPVHLVQPLLHLAMGEVLALDDAAGTRIAAKTGAVWITEEGDRDDHILEAGAARVVARGGRTVLQAMKPAWVSIQ